MSEIEEIKRNMSKRIEPPDNFGNDEISLALKDGMTCKKCQELKAALAASEAKVKRLQDECDTCNIRKGLEAKYVRAMAILDSVAQVLDGEEVSDFMLSFPIVRNASDLQAERDSLQKRKVGKRG